jgi:hypothetical protein
MCCLPIGIEVMAGYREMVSYELNAGNNDRSENEKYRDARIPAGSMIQYFSGGGFDPWISMCPGNCVSGAAYYPA